MLGRFLGLGRMPSAKAKRLILSESAPRRLHVEGLLDFSRSQDLTQLPESLVVETLVLADCANLTQLPRELVVKKLDLQGCVRLKRLPAGLRCHELILRRSGIEQLPDDLQVEDRLDLRSCQNLRSLPNGLRVRSLMMQGCRDLAELPATLEVAALNIEGCSRLVEIPPGAGRCIVRLNARGCTALASLPPTMTHTMQIDLNGCSNLTVLPEGMKVGSWMDIGGTQVGELPYSCRGVALRWRGVPIDERIAFSPESITVSEILRERNVERRRVLLERVGLAWFMTQSHAEVLDTDNDAGGERRLLKVPMDLEEDLVCVVVNCPSTKQQYVLRVPPDMQTCRQAIAWTAGFKDPDQYQPLIET